METCPRKGVLKQRVFQIAGNTHIGGSVTSLGISEGNITGRKNK